MPVQEAVVSEAVRGLREIGKRDEKAATLAGDIEFLLMKIHLHKRRILERLPLAYDEIAELIRGTPPYKEFDNAESKFSEFDDIDFSINMNLETNLGAFPSEDQFMMDLDSLLVDTRRVLEFALRLIAKANNLPDSKLKFQNFLDHLTVGNATPSKLAIFVRNERAEFFKFCQDHRPQIQDLQNLRTQVVHYAIKNQVESATVRFHYMIKRGVREGAGGKEVRVLVFGDDVERFLSQQVSLAEKFVRLALKGGP